MLRKTVWFLTLSFTYKILNFQIILVFLVTTTTTTTTTT